MAQVKGLKALTATDGYKLDHRRQYPEGTEFVYSNWTPRGSRIEEVNEVVFFGLQYFLDHYLGEIWNEFFDGDIDEIAEAYERRVTAYLGPNSIGTQHIRELHALGYLPLEFKALEEGTSVPLRVPMFTVENTDARFFWLVNYMETLISNTLWMACTSATVAKRMRALLDKQAERSGGIPEAVAFQGHDFSMRGMSGLEAANMSGAGHLISFTGTDTIPAIEFVEDYYPTDSFIAGSVAATEHSVMCAGGEDGERETFERLMNLYPSGILSVVSDTWDFWKVLTELLPEIKDKIMAREGTLVIRPDSGDPVKIITGDDRAERGTPEHKGAVQILWEIFGGTVNEQGYKVLDPHIGLIYGDSINFERAEAITNRLIENNFVSTSVVFGMGSYGYQFQTRDTFGFAMKATNVVIDGEERAIFKDPKTDSGEKKSLKGRILIARDGDGGLIAIDEVAKDVAEGGLLETVWKDGKFVKTLSFDQVRANAGV